MPDDEFEECWDYLDLCKRGKIEPKVSLLKDCFKVISRKMEAYDKDPKRWVSRYYDEPELSEILKS